MKTTEQVVDTKEGIRKYLDDGLFGLHRLGEDRANLYSQSNKPLKKWIVAGRFELSTNGSIQTLMEINKKRVIDVSEAGDVLSNEKFWVALNTKMGQDAGVAIYENSKPPPATVMCPECKKGWTLKNAHDFHCTSDTTIINASDFVGKTLKYFSEHVKLRTDALYRITYECGVQNDKHIDRTPHKKYPTLEVNHGGFIDRSDDYILESGDSGYFWRFKYYHSRCWETHLDRCHEKFFEIVFKDAGFESFEMRKITNEYCTCDICGPWFEVSVLGFGSVKIGWRKRVINIDWFGTGRNFLNLFEKEDVTKWDKGIHAWTKDDAIKYLSKIRKFHDEDSRQV